MQPGPDSASSGSRIGTSIIFLLFLSACDSNAPIVFHGKTMGTTYSVQITSLPDSIDRAELQQQLESRLQAINQVMSTYDPLSAISLFNQSLESGWLTTHPELVALVDRALQISAQTENTFDVTVGPLVNLWGFGPGPAVTTVPAPADLNRVRAAVGKGNIKTSPKRHALWKRSAEVNIDLSAIAKGYAVDQLANILLSYDIQDFMVEIGGEIYAKGIASHGDFWRIGIESPQQPQGHGAVQIILSLQNTAIATSGDYRNFFEYEGKRYAHTIDPRTGMPANHDLASVSVLQPTTEKADALATAMMVMGADKARKFADQYQIPLVMILRDGKKLKIDTNQWISDYVLDH